MIDATPELTRKGFWSLASNDESVARGQANFWAILETLLAIAGFWWVALEYETFFLLYTSLFVAPLLFLRSEESVRRGVEWFDNGIFAAKLPQQFEARNVTEERMARRWQWIGAAIGLCIAAAVGHLAANAFLVGHEGWLGFWRGSIFAYALLTLVQTGMFAAIFARTGAPAAEVEEGTVEAGAAAAVAMAGGAVVALAVLGAGTTEVAATITVAAVPTLALVLMFAGAESIGAALMVPFYLPGAILAVLVVTLVIRILATTSQLIAGYKEVPGNILRLGRCTAPFHIPELLPGLPNSHNLRLERIFSAGLCQVDRGV
jgi:hypothetical protein